MESTWTLLLLASIVGSVVSIIGGVLLIYSKINMRTIQVFATPFAAGALLAATFVELLPEAIEHGEDPHTVLQYTLASFVGFFVLERFLHWFHHHTKKETTKTHSGRSSTTSLIVIGDTLHNFIDGLAIGGAFLVSPATGILTTVVVAAHEIPQEIGDFGLLLAKGVDKIKVFWINLASALATVVGAVLVFGLGDALQISEPLLLAVTAGLFIYIAASDIVPSLHTEQKRRTANIQTLMLLFGIIFVSTSIQYAHSFHG